MDSKNNKNNKNSKNNRNLRGVLVLLAWAVVLTIEIGRASCRERV